MSDPVREGYFTPNGLRLHYRDWGDPAGRPIVLIHGTPSHSRIWDGFARAVCAAGAWRVIVPDRRGQGESSWASDYSLERYTEDLVALADHLRLTSFCLVGLSAGGRVAYAYAAAHAEQVERLVIVDRGPPRTLAGPAPAAARRASESFGDLEEAVAAFSIAYPLTPAAAMREAVRHALLRGHDGRWTWRHDPAVTQGIALAPEAEWALLARIECPTLLIRGSESTTLVRETAGRMVAVIPRCELVEIVGSGHLVPLDKPEAFASAALRFLQS